jgi:uncharacterized protein (TIGR03435 family)
VKSGVKIKKEENATIPVPPGLADNHRVDSTHATPHLGNLRVVMQAQFMDLPVIDQTGLGDTRYTFMVKFTLDPGMRPFGGAAPPPHAQPPSSDPEVPPDLFSAMEQQLGLRMQKTKAPAEVMVIDKVEKPSSN